MVKPIFIIKLPKSLHLQDIVEINKRIASNKDLLKDYHVLIVRSNNSDSATFKMFNGKRLKNIDIEQLREELNLTNKK